MKLNDLYRSILAFSGIDVDEQGFAYTLYNENKRPVVIKGQSLSLPTPENLRNFKPGEMIIFHPLSENIAQGESEVIAKLKHAINIKLNFTFGIIAQSLLQIVNNIDQHKRLDADQTDMVIEIGSVDMISMEKFTSLMLAVIKESPDSGFLNIYLKRGGRVLDKKYSRAGIVNFSLYHELCEEKEIIKGIKLRQKDRDLFKKMYKYIFPKIDQPQSYDYGSESHTAPFLDALMKTSLNIAGRINDVLYMFENEIDGSSDLIFDADWVPNFDNLDIFIPEIRRIPMQHGNDGTIVAPVMGSQPAQVQTLQTPTPAQATAAYTSPQQAPQYQQPTPVVQMPQNEPIKTSRGAIDFAANMHRAPAIAAMPPPFMGQTPFGAPQMPFGFNQQNRVPGWANPGQMMPQQMGAPMGYPAAQPMQPVIQNVQDPRTGQMMQILVDPRTGQPIQQQPGYPQPQQFQQPQYPQAPMYQQPQFPQQQMPYGYQAPYDPQAAAMAAFMNQPAMVSR